MSRRRGCLHLSVVFGGVAAFVAMIGGVLFASFFGWEPLKTGRFSDIEDPSRFDLIQAMPLALELAGPGLDYWQLSAQAVRSDGTLDLTADYAPTALIQLFGANGRSAPVGVPGGPTARVVTIKVERPGMVGTASVDRRGTSWRWSRGLDRLELDGFPTMATLGATPPPRCSFQQLWTAAIALGAPADAVAAISHNASGYTFRIEGTPHSYRFDQSCARLP